MKLKRNHKSKNGVAKTKTAKVVASTTGLTQGDAEVFNPKKEPIVFNDTALLEIIGGSEQPVHDMIAQCSQKIRLSPAMKDLRLRSVLRLYLRGVSAPVMAQFLNISLATVYRDIEDIEKEMGGEVETFDVPKFVGMTLAFYDEMRHTAMSMVANTMDKRIKLMAMKLALDAEGEKHKYLTLTGLYGAAAKSHTLYRNLTEVGKDGNDDTRDLQAFLHQYASLPSPDEKEAIQG